MTVGAAPGRLPSCLEIFSIPSRWALSASSSAIRERSASRSPIRLSCEPPAEGRLLTATTHRDREPQADRSKAEARAGGHTRLISVDKTVRFADFVGEATTRSHASLGLALDDPNGPCCQLALKGVLRRRPAGGQLARPSEARSPHRDALTGPGLLVQRARSAPSASQQGVHEQHDRTRRRRQQHRLTATAPRPRSRSGPASRQLTDGLDLASTDGPRCRPRSRALDGRVCSGRSRRQAAFGWVAEPLRRSAEACRKITDPVRTQSAGGPAVRGKSAIFALQDAPGPVFTDPASPA